GQPVRRLAVCPAPVLHESFAPFAVRATRLRVDHPGVGNHFRVEVPVRGHEFADQLEASVELLPRPARQVAVEPADAGRVGYDAELPFHSALATPLAELAQEGIRDLAGQLLPILLELVGKHIVELRDAEVGQVHEAGRIVDDKAYRYAVLRVEHLHAVGLFGTLALELGQDRRLHQPDGSSGNT